MCFLVQAWSVGVDLGGRTKQVPLLSSDFRKVMDLYFRGLTRIDPGEGPGKSGWVLSGLVGATQKGPAGS